MAFNMAIKKVLAGLIFFAQKIAAPFLDAAS